MERWSLATFLPETLRHYFEDVVVAFLQRPVENRSKLIEEKGATVRNEDIYIKETEFVRNLVRTVIHPDLIRMVKIRLIFDVDF